MRAELVDVESETKLLTLIVSEGRVMGAAKARQIFDSLALRGTDFSAAPARALWEVLREVLAKQLAPIRPVLLPILLRAEGAEASQFDPFFESEEVLSETQAQTLARVVKNLASRRRAVEAANRIRAMAESGEMDEFELAAEMAREASTIPGISSGWVSHDRVMDLSDKRVRSVQDGRLHPTVATGFTALDKITGGYQPTLCVICGQPGRAKSALVASSIKHSSSLGHSSAIFSMEDKGEWLTFRWAAHECGVPNFVLKNRPLTEHQWNDYAAASSAVRKWAPIWIDDRPRLTPAEVLFGARNAYEMGAVAVYLDNMTAMKMPRNDRRDLEFQEFLTDARALAEEYNRPFVVVSHTTLRDGQSPDDMPRLVDCSESKAFDKLARLAYGVRKKDDDVVIGILKNNAGAAGMQVELRLNTTSALLEDGPAPKAERQEAMPL